MKQIYEALAGRQGPAVLATVVRVLGSSYRRPGAKMLIFADGPSVGLLSGGCLEADVSAHAADVLAAGQPRLLTYDLRSGDENLWGLNLGCNGQIEVLLEPVDPDFWGPVADCWAAGETVAVVSVLTEGPQFGEHLALTSGGRCYGRPVGRRHAVAALADGRSQRIGELFVDVIQPLPVLWVVGAGADAPPLVAAAAAAGWRVCVADRRAAHVEDPARFPGAHEVVCLEPEALAARVGRGAYAVLLHHHFGHDRDFLTALLETEPRYLGVLGPRHRTELLLGSTELPACVHSPVGLDLGGEGPEAVALSVVAELQAVRHGRRGMPLRDKAAGGIKR